MSRNLALVFFIALIISLPSCGSDDGGGGGTPTIPGGPAELQEMVECFGDGLVPLGFAIETCVILFRTVQPAFPYTPPWGFAWVEDDSTFHWEITVSDEPRVRWEIDGQVSSLETIKDGIQDHDNFTITWNVYPLNTSTDIAAGEFRILGQGLTQPPNQTYSIRVIPAGDIWTAPDDACTTEYPQFELTIHHLIDDDHIRNMLASFWCFSAEGDTLKGYMSGSEATGEASITGTWDGVTYTCDVDLDTYIVDCPGS